MRLSFSFMGMLILVLAVVGLWHLVSSGGKRAASVWLFLSQVALVLGALVLIGILFTGLITGLTHRYQYDKRHAVQREMNVAKAKEAKIRLEGVAAGSHKKPGAETPKALDWLSDLINDGRYFLPSARSELATEEEEVAVDLSDVTPEKGPGLFLVLETARALLQLHRRWTEKGSGLSAALETAETSKPEAERPEWVVHPPKRVGNTYRRVVVSGPYSTVDECHQELEEKLRQAIYQRMAAYGADDLAYRDFTPAAYEGLGIGMDYIYREICRDEYVEELEASFGPMVQVYVLLEFDPSIEQHLGDVWRQYQARYRLGIVTFMASGGLLLLAFVYGLLKVDTWTRGDYSKRLLLGVPVVIIGLVVLSLFWYG
jgi:hypothetical protein